MSHTSLVICWRLWIIVAARCNVPHSRGGGVVNKYINMSPSKVIHHRTSLWMAVEQRDDQQGVASLLCERRPLRPNSAAAGRKKWMKRKKKKDFQEISILSTWVNGGSLNSFYRELAEEGLPFGRGHFLSNTGIITASSEKWTVCGSTMVVSEWALESWDAASRCPRAHE